MAKMFPIYTKPQIKSISGEMAGWPRSAEISKRFPEVAWTEFLHQKSVLEKTVMIEAPVKKVWELVGNPMNVPSFTPGLVSIEEVKKDVYRVTDTIPPKVGETWSTITFEESVLEAKPEQLIRYRIEKEGIQEDFVFLLREEKGKTILTLKFEINFKLLNPDVVENDMDHVLMEVARLSIDKRDLAKRIAEFTARQKK